MKIITNFFISLFYCGYIRIIPPGTFASLISLFIFVPVIQLNIISNNLFIGIFVIIFLLSIYFIKNFSSYTKSHDSKTIVIDEFLGVYLIFIFYDYIFIYNIYLTTVLIFILFRFFDIKKIYPANIIDGKMNNALGVILDDLVAASYTIIVLYIFNVII